MPKALWARWKRLAHHAAVVQSAILLTLLYWVVVVPIGLVRRGRRRPGEPQWQSRTSGTRSLDDARRQF
jgi:hypothetical protein